ncbi:MAG: histidine triad nucleotide-binding protein [Candidatus Zixiibacteriota bacterium]
MTPSYPTDSECLFCKIIAGEIPSTIRYQSENAIAFDDIHPKSKTHVLICPKGHYPTLMDTPPDVVAALMDDVKAVARELGFDERGFRLIVNNGKESGQIVYHLHIHFLAGQQQHGF